MNKISVCHVVCGLKSGGVESMIYNYCSQLDLSKYDMHIIYQHEPSIKNVQEFQRIGFKLKQITSKAKNPIKNFCETYKYFKENNINVIHCHMTLMNFIPLLAGKILKINIRICHSHNSDVRHKNILKKIFENILKKFSIKWATHLVACGQDAGKYMYANKKFSIIYNGLQLNKYKYNEISRKNIREKYNISEEKIVIGHIGRFTEQKNHDFIIEMFKDLLKNNKDYILMLVGDGELKKRIEDKVKSKNMVENIIFAGVVENPYEYYSAFDYFILPSLWEGLPVVSVEAQASGLKCLFSDTIDLNAVIEQEKVEICQLKKEKWIEKIVNNSEIYNRKINIENFVKKNLDINQEVKKLQRLYRGETNV